MEARVYSTPIPSRTWTSQTTPMPVIHDGGGYRRAWRVCRNLFNVRRLASPDDVVIFTDDSTLTASLYGLLHRRGPRPTIVLTDPLIMHPRSAWKKSFLRASLAAVDRLIVWAPGVVERYHRCLGIPRERMVPVRFHHTIQGYAFTPKGGDYLFSGGDSLRDYATLLEAVRGLPIPVRIATRKPPPAGVAVPDNVTLGPSSHAEFRTLMAGARVVAFPLQAGCLRTTGQQSYLNAMAIGKPVIVTDPDDASYYIEDRKTGRLVPPRDPAALREAIVELLDRPEEARAMGERAREFALPLDQEYTWSRVLSIAQQAHRDRQAGNVLPVIV